MSKELKITKERVIEASKKCEEARVALKTLFPEAFEEEWEDITREITWKTARVASSYFLYGYYFDDCLLGFYAVDGNGLRFVNDDTRKETFKLTFEGNCFIVLKKRG